MRLQLVSDIHLEFYHPDPPDFVEKFPKIENINGETDVLILAGDICTARDFERFLPFFRDVCEKFPEVVYVVGNHEHYRYKFQDTIADIDEILHKEKLANIWLLNNSYIPYGKEKIVIWGSSLWTDCNKGDQDTRQALARGMNDFRLIQYGEWDHMLPVNAEDEHRETLQSLQEFLPRYHDYKVVVVTHHAPSHKSIHDKYMGDFYMNGGFVSDLEAVMIHNPQIKLWCHGHVHNSFDYPVDGTRVVANPMGYPVYGRLENQNFNPSLVITV